MAFGVDVERALLLDERLEEGAELGGREARRGGLGGVLARDLHDHHLDGLAALAEQAGVHRARGAFGVDRVRAQGAVAFQAVGRDVAAPARERRAHAVEHRELLGLDVRDLGARATDLALDRGVGDEPVEAGHDLCEDGAVLGRHPLGVGRRRHRALGRGQQPGAGAERQAHGQAATGATAEERAGEAARRITGPRPP